MAETNQQPFLQERNGRYYFRRRIPIDLRQRFDGRTEMVRSLGRVSAAERAKLLADCLKEFEARANAGAQPSDGRTARSASWTFDPASGPKIVREAFKEARDDQLGDLASTELSCSLDEKLNVVMRRARQYQEYLARKTFPESWHHNVRTLLLDGGLQPVEAELSMPAALRMYGEAQIELARREHAYYLGSGQEIFNAPNFGPEAFAADATKDKQATTIAALAELFLERTARRGSASTLQQYRPRLRVIVEALGPKRPVTDTRRADCVAVVENILRKLPSNASKRYAGKSLKEAIAAGEREGAPLLSVATVNLHIDVLQALFQLALDEELIATTPARNLKIATQQQKKRKPFTIAELNQIFSAPLYVGCINDAAGYAQPGSTVPQRHRFWIPLIALYSGMRLSEITLLNCEDVAQENGVWTFQLRENLAEGRSLKTKSSERRVPVHPTLIEIGLLDFVARMKRRGRRLFPDLLAKDRADAFSKWFGHFLKSQGLDDPSLVFHSFRHTFRDACREAEVETELALALGGWADRSVGNRYGSGHSLRKLHAAVAKVSFPGLTLENASPQQRRNSI